MSTSLNQHSVASWTLVGDAGQSVSATLVAKDL
jgi:hypothetical protein